MNLEQKINEIGRILADIRMDVFIIKRSQKELKGFITNPDKLDFERYWKKVTQSKQKVK